MPVVLTPTKAKESLYLLIPKDIAELLEINEETKFTLTVRGPKRKHTLEYTQTNNNPQR